MIAVMVKTNKDKSKIDLAGVDSGAKMFKLPVETGSATVVDTNQRTSVGRGRAFWAMNCAVRLMCFLLKFALVPESLSCSTLCRAAKAKTSRERRLFQCPFCGMGALAPCQFAFN